MKKWNNKIFFLLASAGVLFLISCDEKIKEERVEYPLIMKVIAQSQDNRGRNYKVHKTEKEWKERLTPEQYRITREKGTEPAFSGKYYNFKGKGVYRCVCCGEPLFSSGTKFESGSGWPSFYAPISQSDIAEHEDNSLFMHRTEVVCSNCGAHLGHVFDDGPQPTGLRYCINSAALQFEAKPDSATSGSREDK